MYVDVIVELSAKAIDKTFTYQVPPTMFSSVKIGKRVLVPTGLFMEIPKGCEAQIRARSGLAIRNGITMINGIGTIDSDYRGEIKIPLVNLGDESFVIKNGDRIAQMVISRYETVSWEKVSEVGETIRGNGGFGHTGV